MEQNDKKKLYPRISKETYRLLRQMARLNLYVSSANRLNFTLIAQELDQLKAQITLLDGLIHRNRL